MKPTIFLLFFTVIYAQPVTLTSQEKILIKSHSLQCISTGLWAPFNLVEKGKLVGIGFDYWGLIKKRLGIKSSCQKADSWIEVLDAIRQKKADLTIASQETKERLSYAVFSKPYVSYPLVIATRNNVGFIHDIELIKDKTIVMPRSYATTDILLKHYPDLKITYTTSIDRALAMVEKGEAYATLDILPVIAYKINKSGFYSLKISGSIPESFNVGIMLRKDLEALVPLINRAIDSITQEERNRIHERWIEIHHEEKVPKKYFYILLGWIVFVILFFSFWLLSLKKEITKKRRTEAKLKRLVGIDSLTNVFNRYMLDTTLDKEIALAKRYHTPLSIIFFDINKFKDVNDTHGHKIGDLVLKELAKVVQDSIRKSDVLGRWGGDEFLIILVNTTEKDASSLAQNIERVIDQHNFIEQIKIHCTFGITSYREGDDRTSMVKRVDEHFYNMKRKKR